MTTSRQSTVIVKNKLWKSDFRGFTLELFSPHPPESCLPVHFYMSINSNTRVAFDFAKEFFFLQAKTLTFNHPRSTTFLESDETLFDKNLHVWQIQKIWFFATAQVVNLRLFWTIASWTAENWKFEKKQKFVFLFFLHRRSDVFCVCDVEKTDVSDKSDRQKRWKARIKNTNSTRRSSTAKWKKSFSFSSFKISNENKSLTRRNINRLRMQNRGRFT